MKKWLYLLPLAVPVLIIMHVPLNACSAEPDTVTVNATGANNKVIINSQQLAASFSGKVDAPVQGEINQKGENNSVEINTNNKSQKTNIKTQKANNKYQNTNNKTPKERDYEQDGKSAGNLIKVTQTGKNNSVKINSR